MKVIDSQALDILTKSLGLQGAGSPVTELTDGVVDQTLDVIPIIRRSRTPAASTGLYTALIRNIHASGASSETGFLRPYNPAAGQPVNGWPIGRLPRTLEVWLLGGAVTQLSGTGTLSAALRLDCPGTVMGLSTTGLGITSRQNVAFWDSLIVENVTFGIPAALDLPNIQVGMRLPRADLTQINFSTTSSATATFDCLLTLGLFPVALGQDVIV